MVKGITRRVIVVKSPDRKLFEEAIFIVREDVCESAGMSGDDIVKEAQSVADNYIRSNLHRSLPKIPAPFYALAGALFTGLIWLGVLLFL